MFEVIQARDRHCREVLCAAGARPALTGVGSERFGGMLDRARHRDAGYAPGEGLSYLLADCHELEHEVVAACGQLSEAVAEVGPPPDPLLMDAIRQIEPVIVERLRSDPRNTAQLDQMGLHSNVVRANRLADLPAEVPHEAVARAARVTFWELHATKRYPAPTLTRPPLSTLERNPLAGEQGHLAAAPRGIGAPAAWRARGGRGDGCRFVDVEQGWNLAHEDFFGLDVELLWGRNAAFHAHGANTLGVVVARDNRLGGVGIAHGVTWVRLSSENNGFSPVADTANAVLNALPHLGPGDVLLIEAQAAWGDGFLPVEVDDVVFDVIRLATALGVTVVEPAGNGGRELDGVLSPSGGTRVFDRGVRDSGAVLVAAATASYPHVPLDSTNRGRSVDCYAWGEHVVTTGGDAGHSMSGAYNFDYSGTSSASAIIAGVVLVLQGIAKHSTRGPLTPGELRNLLGDQAHGTASVVPRRDLIGVMPDLDAILASPRYRERLEPKLEGA